MEIVTMINEDHIILKIVTIIEIIMKKIYKKINYNNGNSFNEC